MIVKRRHMMSRIIFAAVTAGVVALVPGLRALTIQQFAGASPGSVAVPGGGLVPGGYGTLTDKKGNSWVMQQNGVLGRAGNSMMNQGLNLRVNNQNFYNYQPLMTADGKEYVMPHRHSGQMLGLQVTRRVRLHEAEGVLRYLEVFENPGGHDVTATVEVRTNFSGNYKTYITEQGNENVTTLGAKESSVLVMPSSSTPGNAFLFTVCSQKGRIKPTISNQNKYSLSFHYNFVVPAGDTVTIMHTVSQVPAPAKLDVKSVAKILKSTALSRFVKSLPVEFRPTLANYSAGGGFGGLALLSSTSLDGLGVERGKQDVLALGEKTRLLGKASCGSLRVATGYGKVEIPFESVAGLVGGNRGRSETARVFLRDGQVFSGKVEAEDLRFVLPSGSSMNLDIDSLDRLVRSETGEEGRWHPDVVALMETYQGDRLALTGGESIFFDCVTSWGDMRFSLEEVLWIIPPEDEPVGEFIEFKDGSRLFGFLMGESIKMQSQLFGSYQLKPNEIRAVITKAMLAKKKEEERGVFAEEIGLQQPHLNLAGGQRLVGQIAAPELNLVTHAELIKTQPEEIRLMRNMSEEWDTDFEDTPPFQVEMWGGSVVMGHVREPVLPVTVRGREWRVPLQDIVSVVYPQPRISDSARTSMARLIRELGDDDWSTRENATQELREYGYLAKSLLVEALRVSGDEEVRRRIEQILGGMD
jgi:hypothetical protein